MIKVNCIVENIGKTGHEKIEVNSVENKYGAVELTLGNSKIIVHSDDMIQAIENCTAKGRRRWVPTTQYERIRDGSEEE